MRGLERDRAPVDDLRSEYIRSKIQEHERGSIRPPSEDEINAWKEEARTKFPLLLDQENVEVLRSSLTTARHGVWRDTLLIGHVLVFEQVGRTFVRIDGDQYRRSHDALAETGTAKNLLYLIVNSLPPAVRDGSSASEVDRGSVPRSREGQSSYDVLDEPFIEAAIRHLDERVATSKMDAVSLAIDELGRKPKHRGSPESARERLVKKISVRLASRQKRSE